jgi:ABC-2 type transport system ATP-binding protein
MSVIDVNGLTYRYGTTLALHGVDLRIEEGELHALVGPNGSGKTTLLQILAGLRRARTGRASVLGRDVSSLGIADRQRVTYVAEGQRLPGWMRLEQLEAYLTPLYPTWDRALARDLRSRFDLDPRRTLQAMSRGQQMKAALLCALAPRPRLVLMDEPFTGMDAAVKDDLVRGLLDSAGTEGWTVLLCSHDIGELEMFTDHVSVLVDGRIALSTSMDAMRERFKRVEVLLAGSERGLEEQDAAWISVERGGPLLTLLVSHHDGFPLEVGLRGRFPDAVRIDVRDATLREIFIALTRHGRAAASRSVEMAR